MFDFDITWSDPIKKIDNNGVYYIRDWLIPISSRQPFFQYWKAYKFAMIKKGYYVEKRDDYDWYLVEKRSNPEDFIELPKPKREILYNQDNSPLEEYKVKNKTGLLPWQIESVSKLVSAVNKWGSAVDGSDLGCHRKGQRILLSDNSTKKVEDIVIGDIIKGWKSDQKVVRLIRGSDEMYKIKPKDTPPFYVNSNHLLTVIDIFKQSVYDIPIKDLLNIDYSDLKLIKYINDVELYLEFKIKKVSDDEEYYGFTLDGDGRYLLDTNIVTHNCGKTYSAIAACRELKSKFIVVCPKAVKESWRRVISNHFNMEKKCLGITNYEQLRTGNSKSPIASYIKNKKTRRKKFVWKIPNDTIIIWDEAQKLKSHKTQNSKVCLNALKNGFRMIFCSATLASNPLELQTIGECIKLFSGFKQYYQWATDHGCKKGYFGGLEFDYNKKSLVKLHNDIFVNRGVRLRRETIPNFPESFIEAKCYDLNNDTTIEINEIYSEMEKELKEIEIKEKQNKNAIKLVTMLRARQKVEMLKVPLLIDLIENGIENEMSIVVFTNFTNTISALSERLNTSCIVDGTIKDKIRQKNIDDFQSDKERIILVNIAAGGAGLSLHQLNDKKPRLALHCPNFSAILTRQALGRVWRTGSNTKSIQKLIYAANTIEEKVCDTVNKKLKNLDLLNDGDLI